MFLGLWIIFLIVVLIAALTSCQKDPVIAPQSDCWECTRTINIWNYLIVDGDTTKEYINRVDYSIECDLTVPIEAFEASKSYDGKLGSIIMECNPQN